MNSEIALAERVGQPPVAQVGARADMVDGRGSCRSSAFERYLTRHCEIVLTHRGHRGHRSPSSSVPLHVSREQAAFVEAMLPVLSPPARGRQQGQPGEAGAAPDDSLQACLSAELDVIEAVERAKAALDAHALTALARMRATTETLVAEQPEPWRTTVPMSADELVALEVTTATGLSQREVHRRLTLATGPAARCGRLRDLVATGATSLYRACEVLEECSTLSDEDLDRVLDTVFAPTRDGAGLTQTLFRSRLRRAILTVDAERAAAKARAHSRIGAFARLDDDGTGTLTIVNDAGKIAAAMDRADAAARAARAKGDPRTLEQLRADFLTDAACYGWPTTAPCPGPDCAARRDSNTGTSGGGDGAQPGVDDRPGGATRPGDDWPAADRTNGADGLNADRFNGADRPDAEGPDADRSGAFGGRTSSVDDSGCCTCGGSGQVGTGFARIGRQPAASVRVIIPFTTLFGFDNAPCELPGYGWIDATQARALASVPDSTWRALLADLDTGQALRLSRKGYRPSQQMIEHVRAVDHTCRGPGCQVPADRCDLDHDIPYPIGPTDITNFTSKHRQHHRVRTARFWKAARGKHDEIIWETAAGRRYVTYPNDWLESTRPPAPRGGSSIDYDPEPFTRPIGPEPDPNQPAPDPGPPPF